MSIRQWVVRSGRVFRRDGTQALVILLCVLVIWSGIAAHLYQTRQSAEREAMANTATFARAFEQNIVRSFDAIDQTLLFVRESYLRDPAHFDISNWGRYRQFVRGLTFQISVINADGLVIASNLGPVTQRIDLSDREHIRVQKQSTEDRLFISQPVIGRVSGKWSLNVTRRMTDADGHYVGTVVVSVDPYYMSRFFESLDLPDGMIALIGADGVVRARAGKQGRGHGAAIGDHLDAAAAGPMLSGATSGSFRSATALDGVDRFVAFRRLSEYPLLVVVALDADAVYGASAAEATQDSLIGAGLSAAAILVGLLLMRQRGRLVRSQAALNATLENISQGIMMIDADGTIQVINPRAQQLLGLPPDLMKLTNKISDIMIWQIETREFGPEQSVDPEFLKYIQQGALDPAFRQYERVRPNGTVLEVRTELLPDKRVVRTYTDITERRANEQALAAARDAAEAGARARAEFLAVMSHEIRTPLNGIIGVASLLLDQTLGPVEQNYVRIIRDSGDHLLQLINDVLDFSRLDTGRLELENTEFELRTLVAGAVEMMTPDATGRGLELRLTMASDVPARAIGDGWRLRQVLLNLVGNGIKFTSVGSVRVDVRRLEAPADQLRVGFAVTDTGIGIPPEAVGRLFTEFSQVDSSISRRFGGSGLGLAISKRLIERMGGTIAVDSMPGRGSTFRFDVRFHAVAGGETIPPQTPARSVAAKPFGLHVLLAEDNAVNRLVATRMLERLGCRVSAVESGTEAVAAAAREPYELVLMDMMMPEMDGLAATAAIRALPEPAGRVPIIGLTANALEADRDACLAAGMNDFATKPITADRLAAAIRRVIPSLE